MKKDFLKLEQLAILAWLEAAIAERLDAVKEIDPNKIKDMVDESEYPILQKMHLLDILPAYEKFLPNADKIAKFNAATGTVTNKRGETVSVELWIAESAKAATLTATSPNEEITPIDTDILDEIQEALGRGNKKATTTIPGAKRGK